MKKCLRKMFVSLMLLSFLLGFGVLFSNLECSAFDFGSEVTTLNTKGAKGKKLTESTTNVVGTIVNTIQIVGSGVAIIMIIYVAIKYMSAAPSEKAEFKKSATAYIVGAVVLFASSQILGVIANFASSNISSSVTPTTSGFINLTKLYLG